MTIAHFIAAASNTNNIYAHAELPLDKLSEKMTLLFTLTKKPPHLADYKKSLQFEKEEDNSPTSIRTVSFVAGTEDNQLIDHWAPTQKVKHLSVYLKTDNIPLDGLTDAIQTICQYTFPNLNSSPIIHLVNGQK